MRIRVEGASSRLPPIVFIHGAGAAATVWLDLFRHFERSRKVVALDLPAHGQSDAWHEVADTERIAHYRDAVGVACAHLEIDRAILVGHSMGGLVALAAAAAYPDKVAGVCTLAAASGMRPTRELLDALSARPEHQAELLRELSWSPTTPQDTVARWFRTVVSADPAVTLADLRAVAAYDASAILPAVKTRCLAIGGMDDLLCPPALVAEMARALPSCEHLSIEDAGHEVHLEQPGATIGAIEAFAAFV